MPSNLKNSDPSGRIHLQYTGTTQNKSSRLGLYNSLEHLPAPLHVFVESCGTRTPLQTQQHFDTVAD